MAAKTFHIVKIQLIYVGVMVSSRGNSQYRRCSH